MLVSVTELPSALLPAIEPCFAISSFQKNGISFSRRSSGVAPLKRLNAGLSSSCASLASVERRISASRPPNISAARTPSSVMRISVVPGGGGLPAGGKGRQPEQQRNDNDEGTRATIHTSQRSLLQCLPAMSAAASVQ